MEPTHPDRLVENVTAPSAGGFSGPDGEVRLRMRLTFRTGSINLRNERGLLLTTTTRTGIHDAPPGLKVRIVAKRRPIANSIICTADAVRDRLHRDRRFFS
ncbi:MAG: hypothetical protein ACOX52_07545 [Verrucomicrobiota bacterium]